MLVMLKAALPELFRVRVCGWLVVPTAGWRKAEAGGGKTDDGSGARARAGEAHGLWAAGSRCQ